MNTANKITLSRFVLTPLFFLAFFLFAYPGDKPLSTLTMVLIWSIFLLSEISDLADGFVARRYHQVTDLGKLMDPFADVIFRVTYFVCFAAVGWAPWWAVMIILWREYSIMFIRMLLIKEGTALAARFWGKFKAFFYFLTGLTGMAALLFLGRGGESLRTILRLVSLLTGASALFAFLSLASYLRLFFTRNKGK